MISSTSATSGHAGLRDERRQPGDHRHACCRSCISTRPTARSAPASWAISAAIRRCSREALAHVDPLTQPPELGAFLALVKGSITAAEDPSAALQDVRRGAPAEPGHAGRGGSAAALHRARLRDQGRGAVSCSRAASMCAASCVALCQPVRRRVRRRRRRAAQERSTLPPSTRSSPAWSRSSRRSSISGSPGARRSRAFPSSPNMPRPRRMRSRSTASFGQRSARPALFEPGDHHLQHGRSDDRQAEGHRPLALVGKRPAAAGRGRSDRHRSDGRAGASADAAEPAAPDDRAGDPAARQRRQMPRRPTTCRKPSR